MSIYLLEVGTEELPYKFIPQAISQLESGFKNFLNDNKVKFESLKVYATPRRLAVIIYGLSSKTDDEVKIIKGPMASIAYDEKGNLTKAGEGFAKKNSLSPSDLYVEDNYVQAKIIAKGKEIKSLLSENVPSIFMKLQGPHFMRWGYNDEKFSRPIKWVVSILDSEEVKIKIIDKDSSNHSRGHRFASTDVVIDKPENYVEIMRNACVIVDQNERKNLIVQSAKQEAEKIGAEPYYTPELLEEVTYITEYPVPVICEFSPEFLTVPQEVVITVMSSHQRYFALHKNGKLINKFITMANYVGDEFKNIKEGNVRVIKARLDDAVFFFNEDTKKPLSDYVESLKGVTFQKGMGSMYDKTQRLVTLSKQIAKDLISSPQHSDSRKGRIAYGNLTKSIDTTSIDINNVERTALLCKADLTTHLVFEFTELQGYIGSDYASVAGENPAVVEGIKQHYYPLNAESETASGPEGRIVGIADKIDTICAVFTAGKKPTGSSDPLGVRRAALGVIRTVIEGNIKIDINKYIKRALQLLPVQKDCFDEIHEFFVQRLYILLSENFKKNVLEACACSDPLADLPDYIQKVEALSNRSVENISENANRVVRIIKDSKYDLVEPKYFKEDAEEKLYNAVLSVKFDGDYGLYINSLEKINEAVSEFFEDVLVMDNDENVKNNRLALLNLLRQKYECLADFSKL